MRRQFIVLIGLLSVACVKSADVKTENIKATYGVVVGENSTLCRAELQYNKDGFTTSLDLTGADKVVAKVNGQTIALNRTSLGGNVFQGTIAAVGTGTPVEFTLQRANDVQVTSTITVPSPFTLGASAPVPVSLSQDSITLSTTPSPGTGEITTWSASGPCVNPVNESPGDSSGGATIHAGTVTQTSDIEPQSCVMTVTMFRTVTGTAAKTLAPTSVITATQSRDVDLSVVQ